MKDFHIHARRRADGSVYLTSPDLPGLHVVCEEGEDPIEALSTILPEFLSLYYAAKLRREKTTIRRENGRASTAQADFDLVAEVAI